MGHEIFFKIFNGPQNVFLCSTFIISFCVKGVGAQNIQTSHKGDLTRLINQIHSENIRQMVVKIKKYVSCILTLMLGSLSSAIDTRYNFATNFLQ